MQSTVGGNKSDLRRDNHGSYGVRATIPYRVKNHFAHKKYTQYSILSRMRMTFGISTDNFQKCENEK